MKQSGKININKTMAIVDGSFYAYRSYFSSKSKFFTKNPDYKYVATYLFLKSILSITKKKYSYIFITFDSKNSSLLRRQDIPDYKMNRPEMPSDLVHQLDYMKRFLSINRIYWIESGKYEADDIIASLSKKAVNEIPNISIDIYSEDRDLFQLVNEDVNIILPIGKKKVTLKNFTKFFPFKPLDIVDYKTIIGDSSDNIKGIRGVGKVIATQWISQYTTIENIIKNAEKLEPLKFRTIVIKQKKQLLLNKKNIQLHNDIDIKDSWYLFEYNPKHADVENHNLMCDKLNIKSLKL